MNAIESSIVALNAKLNGLPFDFAFLGGSVLSLLVNDSSVDAIRVTKDVDIVADVRTRNDFHREERELESRGFKHDMRYVTNPDLASAVEGFVQTETHSGKRFETIMAAFSRLARWSSRSGI